MNTTFVGTRFSLLTPRRLLPYLLALLLIAWVLGSLARSSNPGGVLANSFWLIFAVELLPLIALGMMVVFTIYLVLNAKLFSDALGSGMTMRRKLRKKRSMRIQLVVWTLAWGIGLAYLFVRCHGLNCSSSNTAQTASAVQQSVAGGGPVPSLPIIGTVVSFALLVDSNILGLAFLGLLVVGSIITGRAVLVHLDEVRKEKVELFELVQRRGREAVAAAMKILDEKGSNDPRSRILACYEKMTMAAAELGAPVGAEKTARELERGIRSMFLLKGPGIGGLTSLFEEARYSLHPILEEDALRARDCLGEVSAELNRIVTVTV